MSDFAALTDFCKSHKFELWRIDSLSRWIWEHYYPDLPEWFKGPRLRQTRRRSALWQRHSVSLPLVLNWKDNAVEQVTWIVEELEGIWHFELDGWIQPYFSFQREIDAIHYKLKWG